MTIVATMFMSCLIYSMKAQKMRDPDNLDGFFELLNYEQLDDEQVLDKESYRQKRTGTWIQDLAIYWQVNDLKASCNGMTSISKLESRTWQKRKRAEAGGSHMTRIYVRILIAARGVWSLSLLGFLIIQEGLGATPNLAVFAKTLLRSKKTFLSRREAGDL
jgi:hypothetical protein